MVEQVCASVSEIIMTLRLQLMQQQMITDVLKQIQEITDGGCDFAVEATGAAPCIKGAWEVSDERSIHIQHNIISELVQLSVSRAIRQDGAVRLVERPIGNYANEEALHLLLNLPTGTPGPGPTANLGIHDSICLTKTYHGVSEGDSNPPEYIPRLVQMYKDGQFPLDKISKVYSYKQLDEAIHAMHDGTVSAPMAPQVGLLTRPDVYGTFLALNAQVIKPIIQFA